MILIDKLAYSSAIRNRSPFLKSAFAVGTLLICVAARSFVISFVILILMGCVTIFFSRTSPSHYIKLMIAPFVFLALGTVAIAVNFTDVPMDLLNIAIGSKYIAVSWFSLTYAVRLIIVSLASVSCLYFLILTTPMMDLLYVLKKLHCPSLIIEIMMLTYRYIFVLFDMASSIMTAQNCRLGNISAKSAINGMGNMLSVILIRAMQKANNLFDAMESRCYDGEIKVLYESQSATIKEKVQVIFSLVMLVSLAIWCRVNGGI
ncbi:MAG: cobalt ECF transporter T component CbiQ [Aminipila sp.]